ncbi:hypothetical protein FQR65_LT09779 [Abscondita terminalis]|nr:hypothetical protein FQR65_LT09779 [Abscondita terminalis]
MYGSANISMYFLLLFVLIHTSLTHNVISNRKYCGYQHSDEYERPTSQVSIDEFPWMVQLLHNNESVCSGSLINKLYVLSAAQCLTDRKSKVTAIRLGDYNITSSEDCVTNDQGERECNDDIIEIKIEEMFLHPLYNERTRHNDIALIRLSTPVQFSDYIRPICLPEQDLLISGNVHNLSTSGWGILQYFGEEISQIKKRVPTNLARLDDCKKQYEPKNFTITENQICGEEFESISCIGDGGAPLMHEVKYQWEQVGIMSFGLGCGGTYFTIYTKVFGYLDWIASTIRP